MIKYLIILILILLYSCERDKQLDTVTQINGWNVESLNDSYFIQFPKNYLGKGLSENCFNKMNLSEDLLINQCVCDDYYIFECIGDYIDTPIPDNISRLPTMYSSSFVLLDNKEQFLNNVNEIKGILYYSDGNKIDIDDIFIVDAIYYVREKKRYKSILRVQYNKDKIDTVRMIINTITKK